MSETRVPVTLLTGFLGAGKSTFLNAILARAEAGKIAVIVNEYGDVGLDHDLIEATREHVTLLASGCVCCTIRGDLARTLPDLIARRDWGDFDFTRIVIETTGLADPAPIQRTLVTDPELAKCAYLDGIVTLADCVAGPRTLDAHFEAISQAAMADLILLTKTDLVSEDETAAFRSRLARLNTAAKIKVAAEVAKTPEVLWGCSAMRRGVTMADARAWIAPPPSVDPLANLSGLAPGPQAPLATHHDGRITTASVVLEAPLKRRALGEWLRDLSTLYGEKILRMKGIVFLEGEAAPTVFHAVQHVFDAPVPLTTWTGGDTTSRVVIIARDVPAAVLQERLAQLRKA
ncbi:MAG: GTP-binding protein [Pseudomonadota bacterium]